MKVETKFNIGDKVGISPLNGMNGKIRAVWLYSANEITYCVKYFNDYRSSEEYFSEEELEFAK